MKTKISISEHSSFMKAYFITALAIIIFISLYSDFILKGENYRCLLLIF